MNASNIETFSAVAVPSVNAMPAPTWHRLRVNSEAAPLPEGLELCSESELELEGITLGEEGAFDSALTAFQQKIGTRAAGKADTRAVVTAAKGQAEAGNLDVPALSSYQKKAVLEEVSNNVAEAFETGMGPEAYGFLESAADGHVVLVAEEGKAGSAIIRLGGQAGFANAACVDVIAMAGSHASITLSYEGAQDASGFVGCGIRVFAGVGAEVEVDSIQPLGSSWTVFDDSGYVLDDNAHVVVSHRVLGAEAAYTGLSADLRGNESRIDVTTRYLGAEQQKRDFNYSIKQRGLATESTLDANGVLAGASKKTLRGTIDFVYGCKGSTGNERESVLLADEGVENKTVPVILCDEDDVMGNHGATIGKLSEETLAYMAARGIPEETAYELMAKARIHRVCERIPDEATRQLVEQELEGGNEDE